jgi:hypothetical protein
MSHFVFFLVLFLILGFTGFSTTKRRHNMNTDTLGSVSPVAASKHDGFAIASLVLGICWVWGIGSILAIIFAAVSNKQAKAAGRSSSGLATAGLVLGIIGAALIVLIIIVGAATQ